ncbi:MAG TPA: iron dependent repressor, metal binding and dimerization domain protein, partial [Saccharofermentans sp.]|nr:iron dependent repressor, metal binding and dimerization domain protein [Saccharofermentans sp.]
KETAESDACKIEHVISDASFEAIKNHTLEI